MSDVDSEILAAHTVWVKGSKEIAGIMLMTMDQSRSFFRRRRDFNALKQEEGSQLARILILIGLRKEFDGFVQNYNMHSLGKTVNELHAMLKLHEQTLNLPKNNAPALHAFDLVKHAYAPKPKIPPPPKREDPAKDSICHECGETGHWKRNCPQYLAELLKKKKNTASGAGGGSGQVGKLKPGALSLYVGNGQREAVEAIGNFDLSLPSGLVIVLNNCHYALSITRGVISVSCLYDDGFINRFVNNTIQVSRNNMVYFSAIRRAKLDLDSALLWHCRLDTIRRNALKRYPKETMGYSFYYPPKNKVLVARNAEFLENSLITQEANDDLEIDELQSDIIPVRRSTRARHPTDRMCLYIDAEENELGDLGEPANYKAALLDPESDK
ncbi:zinc finger, CCHC-type containing protein [Tanacetum coccineum]